MVIMESANKRQNSAHNTPFAYLTAKQIKQLSSLPPTPHRHTNIVHTIDLLPRPYFPPLIKITLQLRRCNGGRVKRLVWR